MHTVILHPTAYVFQQCSAIVQADGRKCWCYLDVSISQLPVVTPSRSVTAARARSYSSLAKTSRPCCSAHSFRTWSGVAKLALQFMRVPPPSVAPARMLMPGHGTCGSHERLIMSSLRALCTKTSRHPCARMSNSLQHFWAHASQFRTMQNDVRQPRLLLVRLANADDLRGHDERLLFMTKATLLKGEAKSNSTPLDEVLETLHTDGVSNVAYQHCQWS